MKWTLWCQIIRGFFGCVSKNNKTSNKNLCKNLQLSWRQHSRAEENTNELRAEQWSKGENQRAEDTTQVDKVHHTWRRWWRWELKSGGEHQRAEDRTMEQRRKQKRRRLNKVEKVYHTWRKWWQWEARELVTPKGELLPALCNASATHEDSWASSKKILPWEKYMWQASLQLETYQLSHW